MPFFCVFCQNRLLNSVMARHSGKLPATFEISSDEEGDVVNKVADSAPNTATKRKQQGARKTAPIINKKKTATTVAQPVPVASSSGDEDRTPKKRRNRFGAIDEQSMKADEWLKEKKSAAPAGSSVDDEPFTQMTDGFGVSDFITVQSNLPAPQQNIDFMNARFQKTIFKKMREVEPVRGNGFYVDVPLTENENENLQKFASVRLTPKFHKIMSRTVPTIESGWNPGVYPVRTVIMLRTGFVDTKEQNSTALELSWPAVCSLEQEGKKFMLFFDRKIKGKEFDNLASVPTPPPAVIQVIPRSQKGPAFVAKKGNQVMLTMEPRLFANSPNPKIQFSIRNYYWDAEGKWAPGKQGINIQHKAFHNLIHAFIPVVETDFIGGLERFRVTLDHREEDLDEELKQLTDEQKKGLVYDELVEFEEDDRSQPIIDDVDSE